MYVRGTDERLELGDLKGATIQQELSQAAAEARGCGDLNTFPFSIT